MEPFITVTTNIRINRISLKKKNPNIKRVQIQGIIQWLVYEGKIFENTIKNSYFIISHICFTLCSKLEDSHNWLDNQVVFFSSAHKHTQCARSDASTSSASPSLYITAARRNLPKRRPSDSKLNQRRGRGHRGATPPSRGHVKKCRPSLRPTGLIALPGPNT